MDLFAAKLRSVIRGALNESYEERGGYVIVVDNSGIDPLWVLTMGCEIIIPEREFKYFVKMVSRLLPPEEERENPLSFNSLEDLYNGFMDDFGKMQAGILDGGRDGATLRHQMRMYPLVSSELGPGIYDRLTREEFDQITEEWRRRGFDTEGEWEDGIPHHGPGNPDSENCRWCLARFNRIGGGIPTAPGGRISDAEMKRKINSGQRGWSCGDPVRPKYFGEDKRKGSVKHGLPEWFQYQYSEVVDAVMQEYKKDVIDAIEERLGLEQYGSLRDIVLGSVDPQGIPENMDYLPPEQRYTKRYIGAPPHMQHRETEHATGVKLGMEMFRSYYVQVKLHLDPKNSETQKRKQQKVDDHNEGDDWYQRLRATVAADKQDKENSKRMFELADAAQKDPNIRQTEEYKALFDDVARGYSGFVKHLMTSIREKTKNPEDPFSIEKTDKEYTNPVGQKYEIWKIPTGIKGLNFLVDPFMPVKQREIDKREKYHGRKKLEFEPGPASAAQLGLDPGLLGMHQNVMHSAYGSGSANNMILGDLQDYLQEKLDGSFGLVPWHPQEPFPIDDAGNIYVILDDDTLTLTATATKCPCTGTDSCHSEISPDSAEESVRLMRGGEPASVLDCKKCMDPKTGPCRKTRKTKEMSGRIVKYDEKTLAIDMLVNKFSCIRCKEAIGEYKKELNEAVAQKDNPEIIKLKRKIEEIEGMYSNVHPERFERDEYLDTGRKDFLSDENIGAAVGATRLGDDTNTYALWSNPWLLLNLKRMENEDYMVAHPFERKLGGPLIRISGPGGLVDLLMTRLKEKAAGADDKGVKKATNKIKRTLLKIFQEYDLQLIHPNAGKIKYGDDVVDISGLTWMDKIAIPINFTHAPPIRFNEEDPDSIIAYERWLTTKRIIATDTYLQIVPHSIIRKHLGMSPEEEIRPIVKAGEGTIVPYAFLERKVTDEEEEEFISDVGAEVIELADALQEPEGDKPAEVEALPGGTPYSPEYRQADYIEFAVDDGEEEEEEGYHTSDFGGDEDEDEEDEGYNTSDFG